MLFGIKRGNLGELGDIQKLNSDIFKEYWETPYSLDKYLERLEDRDFLILLAKKESHLVGDLIAFPEKDSFYVWLLAVKEKFRRQGIGNKLLEECELYAGQQGFPAITAKVYNVSREMQRLLVNRGYNAMNVKPDPGCNSRYNAVVFRLDFDE